MLIIIILIVLLIVGIALLVIFDDDYLGCYIGGGCLTIISSVVLIICLLMIIITQTNKDIEYQCNYERREMLEYRLENQDKNLVGGEMLYQEIRDFNEDLRFHKAYINSPWIGCFLNERNAEFDYIDYKER